MRFFFRIKSKLLICNFRWRKHVLILLSIWHKIFVFVILIRNEDFSRYKIFAEHFFIHSALLLICWSQFWHMQICPIFSEFCLNPIVIVVLFKVILVVCIFGVSCNTKCTLLRIRCKGGNIVVKLGKIMHRLVSKITQYGVTFCTDWCPG